jgi:hypothetical protein
MVISHYIEKLAPAIFSVLSDLLEILTSEK